MNKDILTEIEARHYFIDDIDVSSIIQNKEKLIVQMISNKDNISFEESYHKYLSSNLCNRLRDPYTGLFTTNIELLYEDFKSSAVEQNKEK